MLVPPSRNIASIPFSTMSRRAFSIRARRWSSLIGTTGGLGCREPSASESSAKGIAGGCAKPSRLSASVPSAAELRTNVRRSMVIPRSWRLPTSLRERQVLRVDVRKSPRLELSRPRPKVVLRHAHEWHLDLCGDVLLEIDMIEDRLHRHVAPEVRL